MSGSQRELDRILRIIEKKRHYFIDFLKEMIRFDSSVIDHGVKGLEGKAQEWISKKLKEIINSQIDVFEPKNNLLKKYTAFVPEHSYDGRPNVVGVLKGTGGGRSMILNGHIDTMPVNDENLWSHKPFKGEIENGKIYGRGACDMKAGVAAMIMAIECIVRADIKLKGDVIIEIVVDEEGGGNGTLACVQRGYRADVAIVTEPTGLDIKTASMGAQFLEIQVRGEGGHPSKKWEHESAIRKMIEILGAIDKLQVRWLTKKSHPLFTSPKILVGEIAGGTACSVIPERCVVKICLEYLPTEIDEEGMGSQVREEVENWILDFCQGDKWLRVNPPVFRWYADVAPYSLDSSHSLVRMMKNVCTRVLEKGNISVFSAGCDARLLANIAEIPTIIFGPGDTENAHGIDESVSIDDFINAIKAITIVLLRWCQIEDAETSGNKVIWSQGLLRPD